MILLLYCIKKKLQLFEKFRKQQFLKMKHSKIKLAIDYPQKQSNTGHPTQNLLEKS